MLDACKFPIDTNYVSLQVAPCRARARKLRVPFSNSRCMYSESHKFDTAKFNVETDLSRSRSWNRIRSARHGICKQSTIYRHNDECQWFVSYQKSKHLIYRHLILQSFACVVRGIDEQHRSNSEMWCCEIKTISRNTINIWCAQRHTTHFRVNGYKMCVATITCDVRKSKTYAISLWVSHCRSMICIALLV